MPDISLTWSTDLQISPTGDLAVSDGPPLGTERVLRRLMTNPGDYIWHPEYGAGLGGLVGYPIDAAAVEALIRSQMQLESAVAQTPEPVIAVQADLEGRLYAAIRYADAETSSSLSVTLQVGS